MITYKKTLFRDMVLLVLFVAPNILCAQQPAQASTIKSTADKKLSTQLVANAKTILDSWDAVRENVAPLDKARVLLQQAQTANALNASSYVQTARYNLLMRYAYGTSMGQSFPGQAIVIAEMAAKHALELDPKLLDAYIVLADIYQVAGDLKKSASMLDVAEDLGCKSPWLKIQRALIAARTKGPDDQAVFNDLSVALNQAEKMGETRAIESAAYGIAAYYQVQKKDNNATDYIRKAEKARNRLIARAKAIATNT